MIYEYTNNLLNELISEADKNDNRLALAITECFEAELEQQSEQSEQQKRTVHDEVNEYIVQDIPEFGKYFTDLIKNIIEDKGAKKKTKQHIVNFVNAIENDFSPETQEAFDSVLVDIKRLAAQ